MEQTTLYERLGGAKGIAAIVESTWANHISNPAIKNRYVNSDPEEVKRLVREFFCAGIGGPETYTGRDMLTTHTGMNINDEEFNAVVDDVLAAMKSNDIDEPERNEVLAILWSMKGDIVHV